MEVPCANTAVNLIFMVYTTARHSCKYEVNSFSDITHTTKKFFIFNCKNEIALKEKFMDQIAVLNLQPAHR